MEPKFPTFSMQGQLFQESAARDDVVKRMEAMSIAEERTNYSVFDMVLGPCMQFEASSLEERKQALYLGRLVCKIATQAIDAFGKKEFSKFDALVSENLCQIRAAMIASLAKEVMEEPNYIQELDAARKLFLRLDRILNAKAQSVENQKHRKGVDKAPIQVTTFGTLLREAVQEIDISEQRCTAVVIPMALSYMLEKTRRYTTKKMECADCGKTVDGLAEVTESNKLAPFVKLTNRELYDKVVEVAKASLSLLGCEYMEKAGRASPSPIVSEMLSTENRRQTSPKEGKFSLPKTMLPCIYTLQGVMDIAEAQGIPIVVKSKLAQHNVEVLSDRFDTIFSMKNGSFVPVVDENPDSPCIVIEGQRAGGSTATESVDEYHARLSRFDFRDIVLMNGADHPQYAGGLMVDAVPLLQNEIYREEVERVRMLAQRGLETGCSDQNQTLFKITHIFCDVIANQTKEIKQ